MDFWIPASNTVKKGDCHGQIATQDAFETLQELRSSSHFWRRFRHHRLAMVRLGILAIMILISLFAPLLTFYSPTAPNLAQTLLPPSAVHPLGTDDLGRDALLRLMYGGRISFLVGFGSTIIATTIGVIWGAMSTYLGGIYDRLMMRFVDLVMSFPVIFLLLIVLNFTGSHASIWLMVLYLYSSRIIIDEFPSGLNPISASISTPLLDNTIPFLYRQWLFLKSGDAYAVRFSARNTL